MSDGQYQRRSAVIDLNIDADPCGEIHMQASMESIADMVQNSSKYKPGDKVSLRREILATDPDINTVYTVLGARWSAQGIMYILEYLGKEMETHVHEESLRLAPVNERRTLDL